MWIGINDISDSVKYALAHNITVNFPAFYTTIVDAQFRAMQCIHDAG